MKFNHKRQLLRYVYIGAINTLKRPRGNRMVKNKWIDVQRNARYNLMGTYHVGGGIIISLALQCINRINENTHQPGTHSGNIQ